MEYRSQSKHLTRNKSARGLTRGIASLALTSLVLGGFAPAALASTSMVWGKANIEFPSYTAKNVARFVEGGTTYMPVWYVLQALKKSGYQYTFNGKTLNIQTPKGVTQNTQSILLGSGNLTLEVNGKPVKRVNSQVYVDPAAKDKTQFIPIYYIQQILGVLGFYNQWDGTNWTAKQIAADIMGSTSVQVGQPDALAFSLTDANGNAMMPTGNVTWSVSSQPSPTNASGSSESTGSHDGATIDPNTGLFTASNPGTYVVTATANGITGSTQVVVYGQAAGVKLSQSSSPLVANGVATDTVTVQAVDANGNPIPTFDGEVALSIPTSGGTFLGGITTGSVSTVPVFLTNGSGTATLFAPATSPGASQFITASNLTSINQTVATDVNYPSLPVNYVAPSAASISLTPTVSAVNANGASNLDTLTATLNDATGNVLAPGSVSPIHVTFTISGPGSFQQSGPPVTQYSEYVNPGPVGATVPIYSIPNQPGTITVTAKGGGLTSTATVISQMSMVASGLQVAETPGNLSSPLTIGSTTLPAGTGFTLYTVQLVDANGNPMPEQDTLSISDNMFNPSNTPNDMLYYYTVSSGQPAAPLAGTSGTYTAQTSGATGQFQFIVVNSSFSFTPASIKVKDQTTGASGSASYVFH